MQMPMCRPLPLLKVISGSIDSESKVVVSKVVVKVPVVKKAVTGIIVVKIVILWNQSPGNWHCRASNFVTNPRGWSMP
jgi:hypothetical protein